jgi:hypothetical protein
MALALGFGLLAGCSSHQPKGATEAEFGELQEVNDLLHAAAGEANRVPKGLADLSRQRSMYPRGYEAVKSGNVVVLWGAPLKGEGDAGKDEAIIAYYKGVPTDGGFVLLSAGTVKKMTAAEFSSAPKAGKT